MTAEANAAWIREEEQRTGRPVRVLSIASLGKFNLETGVLTMPRRADEC